MFGRVGLQRGGLCLRAWARAAAPTPGGAGAGWRAVATPAARPTPSLGRLSKRNLSEAPGNTPQDLLDEDYNAFVTSKVGELQAQVWREHAAGNLTEALLSAQECAKFVERHFTRNHPVYASSVNNIAFLHKAQGNLEQAAEQFVEAVQLYTDVLGTKHLSTATALHNLGLCYKAEADCSKGIDKEMLLMQSRTAVEDSLAARRELAQLDGVINCDVALSLSALASIQRDLGKPNDAEAHLREALQLVEVLTEHVPDDRKVIATRATVMNNLAYHCMTVQGYEEALELYMQAWEAREKLFGKVHVDTLATRHNIVEALHAMGEHEAADAMRQSILGDVEEGN